MRSRSGSVVTNFELQTSKATQTTYLWRESPEHTDMAANYDEVEDLILAYNDADVIDVDEALLLHDIQDRRNPHFPYWTYEKF